MWHLNISNRSEDEQVMGLTYVLSFLCLMVEKKTFSTFKDLGSFSMELSAKET